MAPASVPVLHQATATGRDACATTGKECPGGAGLRAVGFPLLQRERRHTIDREASSGGPVDPRLHPVGRARPVYLW